MQTRAEILDKEFSRKVLEGKLPPLFPESPHPAAAGLSSEKILDLLESQMMSRLLDLEARVLKAKNESFYTIGSSGHEGNAAVAEALRLSDMAFLHYRSGAFMIQRAKKLPGSTPLYDGLLSLVASSEDHIAGGRHKVFGSLPLFVPPQTSTIASHLPKALGAAISIPKAKSMAISTALLPSDGLILCSFGDASLNHSTAQGAFNSAAWCSFQNIPLPLIFLCEDNGIGISVPTPQGWVETTFSNRSGLKYFSCNGLNIVDAYQTAVEAAEYARSRQRPVFLHMKTVRLLGHAGSDIETTYHSLQDIERAEARDPLLYTAHLVLSLGLMGGPDVIGMYESLRARVRRIASEAVTRPKLITIEEVQASVVPPASFHQKAPALPTEEERKTAFAQEEGAMKAPQHMAKLITWTLTDLMLHYPNIVLFGEDVAKKGGVYHVTGGLFKKFGPKRVFNTLLDEQTILGTAIGLAHNGFVPIPEIQFLAYLHNAEDQVRGEAATLSFFSQGQYTNPMVIRIPGLAYQKGFGGHFHNDNSLAVLRDIPGIVVACPSNGQDAVGMLRECVRLAHEERRVVVFIEPIALYMTRDLHDKGDSLWAFTYPHPSDEAAKIPLGQLGLHGDRKAPLAIVTYGNGTYYSLQAAKTLEQEHGIKTRIIDLRWIAPLNEKALIEAVRGAEKILIVEECRKTGSLSEGLVAALTTDPGTSRPPKIRVLAAADCFIPLGVAAVAGLPLPPQIVKEVLSL